MSAPEGFSDRTLLFADDFFPDGLGLPKTVDLYNAKNQPVVQYRVTASTNVLGWEFPVEFYLAQYGPAETNGWELHFTAKGKLISIGPGADPANSKEEEKK